LAGKTDTALWTINTTKIFVYMSKNIKCKHNPSVIHKFSEIILGSKLPPSTQNWKFFNGEKCVKLFM
jgi:hypothetical protein